MKYSLNEIENMINNGFTDLSSEEIENLIEIELSKDESEIDTDYIDMCFKLLELPCENKKKPIKVRSMKVALIAAAIIVILLSSLSVFAQTGSINPIKNISVIMNKNNEKESTTKKHQETVYYNEPYSKSNVKKYPVPDFLGETYNEQDIRSNEEWNRHFNITYSYENSDYIAEGYVISQSIEPGKTVRKGTEIVIVVSIGEKLEDEYAVPNFIGSDLQTIDSIEEYSKHFTIEYQYVESEEKNIGVVLNQSVAAGEMVPTGTQIILTVGTVEPTESDNNQQDFQTTNHQDLINDDSTTFLVESLQ